MNQNNGSTIEKFFVCYWPGREKNYSRNRVLLNSMRQAGLTVLDCSSCIKNPIRYGVSFFKFLKNYQRADVIFIGFCGHHLVPIARLLTKKPIIFDSFISIYMTLCIDRESRSKKNLISKLTRWLDQRACEISDIVICDTQEHINFFGREYDLNPKKFTRIWVGADETVMYPRPKIKEEKGLVHFHGEFQPLHGVEHIIRAAALLPDVRFRLIGKGKTRKACEKLAKSLNVKNVEFMDPVPYHQLPDFMAEAEICLGIFGDSIKAKSVIPHKIFEALAMGKPVITADTTATRELLTHGENAYLCPAADVKELINAVNNLMKNHELRDRVSINSKKIFDEKASFCALESNEKYFLAA